jgi:hypothetical protein
MVSYLDMLENGKKSLKVADHMLTITHNIVNDPKLFLIVLQKLYACHYSIIEALLNYDLYNKRIPPFPNSFPEMFNLFKVRMQRRYSLNQEYVLLVQDVYYLFKQHKEGPVGFSRKGSYVLCSTNYDMKVLSKQLLDGHVQKTKLFIRDAEHMINK